MVRMARFLGYFAFLAAFSLTTAAADGPQKSKFKVYGYLTQAYALADGVQVLGINEDGTFEYRNAALQLRYEPDDRNTFIVQLGHSETGDSAFEGEDLEVDWAFYRHEFKNGTSFKLGQP